MAKRKQYLLRIDPEVWDAVEHWAADDLRSVNAQVEFILRNALRRQRGIHGGDGSADGAESTDKGADKDLPPRDD